MQHLNKFFSTNQIKRFKYPSCKDCKHFIPDKTFKNTNDQIIFGRCDHFAQKDLVTGDISLMYASSARIDCGDEAKYFATVIISEDI